jgi:D-glycero-D-manno-heptose 1,7-bisphosphate phosphatase
LIKKNYYIFIITNQAGIAKKKFTIEQFYRLHKYLKFYLNYFYINIDDVQFCPYHKKGLIKKYKIDSILRKPKTGMINNINKKWFTISKKNFFIGDKYSDSICAKNSNIYFEYPEKNFFNQIVRLTKK